MKEEITNLESAEKYVEVLKISTIFSNSNVLEKVADKLLSEGVISGFHIDKIIGGYIFKGKKIEEDQYSLEILIEESADETRKQKIKDVITETIGQQWEVPAIEEERVTVNEKLLNFIKRAEIEHGRFITERKKKLSLTLAALVGISSALAVLAERYVEHREQEISKAEKQKAHDKVEALLQEVQDQIREIESNEMIGKHLTPSQNADIGVAYDETTKIGKTISNLEFEMSKLLRPEK